MEKTDAAGAALADAGASLLESLPGVGLIMGMLPEGEEATAGERLKADVVDAVRNVLGPAGGGRDLIWFIDDLHGADDESWEILSHLFRDLTERPVEGARLIAVLAEQVEEGSRTAPLDKHCDIERLALPPLAAEEIAPLVAATGLRTPDKRQVDWLLTMAEVPAHLLSVLRYLELQGLITDGALPSADDLIAMPDPVPADLLERELDDLVDELLGEALAAVARDDRRGAFHPKTFAFRLRCGDEQLGLVIVGSANLTRAAMELNTELGVFSLTRLPAASPPSSLTACG